MEENRETKGVAILGSTGSIGTQALEVISEQPDRFRVEVLTAQSNVQLLREQALRFKPNTVVIGDESHYAQLRDALWAEGIKVYAGKEALCQVCEMADIDIVLTALVGAAGLEPTVSAIRAGKHIALANKETLVVAGEIITALARENGVNIYPVDSEHSAIFQCMAGEWQNPIEKIVLTASGGPFRGKDAAFLAGVTKESALRHPNWTMGAKITIDSATLMNKGLEVIEAKWLFGLRPEQIEVIVHPQSIIHSIVQFTDGSMKAQMGLPDMKLPIQYALGYPDRLPNQFPRFDFTRFPSLTFEPPDLQTFLCLPLAFEALRKGGNMPCILNAANEIAVGLFLQDKIGFPDIPRLVESAMQRVPFILRPDLNQLLASDTETRQITAAVCAH
jgi:1-deoxy-D-xylulose-5-phosphate reductoisomerase